MKKILLLLCTLLGTVGAWATDVTVIDKSKDAATYGTLSNGTFTTNDASGMADVTISGISSTTATNFAYGACLGFTSVSSGTVTMTAPTGYIITGYTFTGRLNTYAAVFTITPSEGGEAKSLTTGGVEVSATGLNSQTATFTYSCSSTNSWYIPSLVISVLSASAQTVNVTYELWDSDGAAAISSETKVQEANSEHSAPASWMSSPIYSYTTQGTIGSEDCTIKVIRTKIGVVTAADLSNSKCYTIRTYDRGWWVVPASATQVTSTTKAGLATAASDTKQCFAFITYDDTDETNDGIYLYSVSEKKFISKSGSYTILSTPGDKVTLPASSGDDNYPTVVALNGTHAGISNGYNPAVITSWQSLSDGGNRCAIVEAADFDPTEALAALNDYFHPNYTVTYIVKDGNSNVLFTSDPVGTTNGANITELPAEYQLTNFYTYNTVNVTISNSGNTNVEFTATPVTTPLVRYTADTSNPYYYNLNIRSQYLVYNSEATGEVTLQSTSEPFNANASWAFIGEPYAGFKVINKTKGTDYFLTYTSVVTGGNSGNNNIQFVEADDFNNRYWIVDKNTGGFVLRMKENTNIYFHHDNSYKLLRTCSVSEWGAVHNDAGSTIVASTDEDVLIALYNSMKDITYSDAIGQYSAEGVTAADANLTISQVGSAIDGNMTSAYAAAYAALNLLQGKTTLNSPAAGFYRVKNVATGKYLTAVEVTGYASETKGVFANGNGTDAATVIMLTNEKPNQDAADGIYMYNQGYGFGWVDADKAAGSGLVWVTPSPDKYVNWFPGTAAGQIGFAICYGNGTGGYAQYLTRGIYTADSDESVIGGTDYTADAAQWIFEPVTELTVDLNDGGDGSNYATLCVPFAFTSAAANTLALNADGYTLDATPVSEVAAGTPVLLKSEDASVTLTLGSGYAATPATGTALTGTYLAKTIDGDTDYVLGTDGTKVGFFHWDSNALGANRAYIVGTSGNSVKGYVVNFGLVDGLSNVVKDASSNNAYFDLSGRRVSQPARGLYIVNGKKIVVK